MKSAAKHFWDYYLILEADFMETTKFVEINEANYSTYSIKFVQLLLSIGSELDVILKAFCELLDAEAKLKNAKDYKSVILNHSPSFQELSIVSLRFGLKLKPFENWSNIKQPDWWNAYNAVKHRRDEDFDQANLEMVLNALAALYLLNMHFRLELRANESPDYPIEMKNVLDDFPKGMGLFRLDDPFLNFPLD